MKTTEGHDTGSVESWLVSTGRDRSPGLAALDDFRNSLIREEA